MSLLNTPFEKTYLSAILSSVSSSNPHVPLCTLRFGGRNLLKISQQISLFQWGISALFIVCLLFTASCGFTPVYKTTENGTSSTESLRRINIITERSLIAQRYKTHLSDLLNPTSDNQEPLYNLDVKLDASTTPLAIQQDRTITRFKVEVRATYTLTRIADGTVIDEGSLHREGGYDKVSSDYATYISDEDATRRVTRELAEDTRIRMMGALLGI